MGKVIHKIVEIIIDLNLDSWYKVDRNRIGNPEVTKILFLVAIYESSHEQLNLGVKTETSDIPPNREAW